MHGPTKPQVTSEPFAPLDDAGAPAKKMLTDGVLGMLRANGFSCALVLPDKPSKVGIRKL